MITNIYINYYVFISYLIGFGIIAVGSYQIYLSQRRGLENMNKAQRSAILRANYKSRLPIDPSLWPAAQNYSQVQLSIISRTLIMFLICFVGYVIIIIGLHTIAGKSGHGLGRYVNFSDSPFAFYVLLTMYTYDRRVRRNAEHLKEPSQIDEPPAGDERWWTGRW